MAANPEISEFVASNSQSFLDGDGLASDWIELHNSGDAAIDLAGWHLTDDDELTRWTFPTFVLEPGQYRVVFASGPVDALGAEIDDYIDPDGRPHTNFRLSADGERLALVMPDGVTIASQFEPDGSDYPKQPTDVSYGLQGGQLRYFPTPTPEAPNTGGVLGLVGDTSFSVDRGFYSAPIAVEITTETPSTSIYYTTNGSVPSPTNGSLYSGPISISTTATLRAAAFRTGYIESNVDTHTYVFPSAVVNQTGVPSGYPSVWATGNSFFPGGNAPADYGISQSSADLPRIAGNPSLSTAQAKQVVADSLLSLPTMSIVTSINDLFGSSTGIYTHSTSSGVAWERPTSVEMFYPDDPLGDRDFQVNAGIRIQGGAGRQPERSPKHGFRLLFKEEYGYTKLDYPLFGDDATDSFDTVILRPGFNNSIVHWAGFQREEFQNLRDQFARDSLLEMEQIASHGTYVHLYLNGLYWGVYNLVERPSAPFASAYNGGDKDDYDALNSGQVIDDGNRDSWNAMMGIVNAGVTSAEAYEAAKKYIDVVSLADYFVLNFYVGTEDWDHHNWYAARKREYGEGFKFFEWDAERSLEDVNINNLGVNNNDNPSRVFKQLIQNDEFKQLFADRVQKHFFNDGALTPENAIARYAARANEIEESMITESARWGDYRRDVHNYSSGPYILFTAMDHWAPERDRILEEYLPFRRDIVYQQFIAAGWISGTAGPEFFVDGTPTTGGQVAPASDIAITGAPGETLWYTLDGTDPYDPANASGAAIVDAQSQAKWFVPSAGNGGAALSTTWTGAAANEPFDDSTWIDAQAALGFDAANLYDGFFNHDASAEALIDSTMRIGVSGAAIESGGRVTVEAENYFAINNAGVSPTTWQLQTEGAEGFTNARGGLFMRVLPDAGGAQNTGPFPAVNNAPYIDYKVQINTPGQYRLYIRAASNGGSSDSYYAGIVELQNGAGSAADFYVFTDESNADFAASVPNPSGAWDSMGDYESTAQSDGNSDAPLWTINSPGTYTVRFSPREYGIALDAFVLQRTSLADPNTLAGGGSEASLPASPTTGSSSGNSSLYMRTSFDLTAGDLDSISEMTLRMRYDDGFAAYLNGVKIASANAPASPAWNSVATASHQSYTALYFESFDVSQFRDLLREGENTLAIHGMNRTVSSTNFLLEPELRIKRSAAIISSGDATSFLVPLSSNGGDTLGSSWTAVEFDDSAWTGVQTGVGYDVSDSYDSLFGYGAEIESQISDAMHVAGGAFVESNGIVVVEAEDYHVAVAEDGSGGTAAEWVVQTNGTGGFSNARGGSFVRVLPDISGKQNDNANEAPTIDYRVQINTPGTYQLYFRAAGLSSSSDTLYASIVELQDGLGGTHADWYMFSDHTSSNFSAAVPNPAGSWDTMGNDEFSNPVDGNQNAAIWQIDTPGVYTVRFSPREYGVALDAFLLQNVSMHGDPNALPGGGSAAELPESPQGGAGVGDSSNTSLFLRVPFTVEQSTLDSLTRLVLRMKYDDGFVAYINGVQVASANAPASPAWNSESTATRSDTAAVNFADFDISDRLDLLLPGQTNVLAIHALNAGLASSDLLIVPELIGGDGTLFGFAAGARQYDGPISLSDSSILTVRSLGDNGWSPISQASFTVASSLRVSEIMYNQPGPDDAEFIELTNAGSNPINLAGVTINGLGGDYTFGSDDNVAVLPPGGFVVIVANRALFSQMYPDVPVSAIADRAYNGALDNNGETITLLDATGAVIQSFRYDDRTSEGWYDETDGAGYSLVPIDLEGNYNDPANWRPSTNIGGSPGEIDPVSTPINADFNGDNMVDRADLVRLVFGLGITSGATRFDGDANGDQRTTLVDVALAQSTFGQTTAPAPSPVLAATTEPTARSPRRLASARRIHGRDSAQAIDLALAADAHRREPIETLLLRRSLRARRAAR